MNKVILITGASSGIGEAAAKLFLENGNKVFATARSLDRLQKVKALGGIPVVLDVTKEDSIQTAFKEIYGQTQNIDVLVNNAGFGQNGFLEELTMDQLRYQFEVNVFGLIRTTQMVLPQMRAAESGRIINIGSVGGSFTSAGASAYHATKYALESFNDGLRQEVSQFGIDVILIRPSGVETEFVNNSAHFYPEPIENSPYLQMRENYQRMLTFILNAKSSGFPILDPVEVAKVILEAAQSDTPQTRYPVGDTAVQMPQAKASMSDKDFDAMIMSQLGLLN
ncbi:MAG: SDR family NAD(P)-dependent oxidoreductase [Verrucomicrobia bacterium]|nr:SDR family NAD(P)-dependent oxidoreductase [Cytophagales bacterium]